MQYWKHGGIQMKLFLSLATALFFSLSAVAADSMTMELNLNPGATQVQGNQYLSYNFGSTPIHLPLYANFRLSNSGPMELLVQRIAIAGIDFSAYYNCPRVMAPGTFCTIRVRFNPWNEGFKTGALYINTNDGLIQINLSGWARAF
jgi:hypothetical protein